MPMERESVRDRELVEGSLPTLQPTHLGVDGHFIIGRHQRPPTLVGRTILSQPVKTAEKIESLRKA